MRTLQWVYWCPEGASIRQRWGENAVHESSKLKPLLTKKIEAVKTMNRFGGYMKNKSAEVL